MHSYRVGLSTFLLNFSSDIFAGSVICETMTYKQKSMMDIDIDSSTCNLFSLKRYNSAPYISTTVGDINTSNQNMTQAVDTVAR